MLALPPPAYLFHTKAGVRNLLLCKLSLYSRLLPSWFHFKSRTSQVYFSDIELNFRDKIRFLSQSDDDILPQTWPMVCKQFWVDFYCWAALLMEHSAFFIETSFFIFSISSKKVSLIFKRSPKNLQLLKGMKIEAALRVKREKQIAHICSDDDAKKCLLINLIMVINCHQIPLLRWASENSKPANVSKARKIFSYLTS